MRFAILKVILWPRNTEKQPRVIEFKEGMINVLTGDSQTGKSSLVPIIDYCLGSGKCAIPVGIIRQKTEWFGLLIQTASSQILVARREPGAQIQTGDLYLVEGSDLGIPKTISKNSSVEVWKSRLNHLAGLPNLDFAGGDVKNHFESRAGFRDLAAFGFQPQHIVANPFTLFFKADTYEHREKLKTIFPLVLGATDSKHLERKRELRDLEGQLQPKLKAMEAKRRSVSHWIGQIKSYYFQAKELGFLRNAPPEVPTWEPADYINVLRRVPLESESIESLLLERGTTARAVERLVQLREEESNVARSLSIQRTRLHQMGRLADSAVQYTNALTLQAERASPIGWFKAHIQKDHKCPVCKSETDSAVKEIQLLSILADEVAESSGRMNNGVEILSKEIAETNSTIASLEESLNQNRVQQGLVKGPDESAEEYKQTTKNIYKFVGMLQQSLADYNFLTSDPKILDEIRLLEGRIEELRRALDSAEEKKRISAALQRVTSLVSPYLPVLEVEAPKSPVKLDIKELTLRVVAESGREDFLWEVGSGANWMGYHVATLLALHEYLGELRTNPVPQFLVFDQPSQVYFPQGMPSKDEITVGKQPKSDDLARVRQIFKALSMSIKQTKGRLQLIVIEHADEITWKQVDNIHLVERWRGGKALIPIDW